MRLDLFLAENALASSRSRAQQMIREGLVTVNGIPADKPSLDVDGNTDIKITEHDEYAGRGAYKLLAALDKFEIDVGGAVCADIGASTGGFTDILLRRGASRVYAVDVGHGQLVKRLAEDERVISIEGKNARELTENDIPEKCGIITVDLSFISQTLVLPSLLPLLAAGGGIVTLIKPQFEAGRAAVHAGHGIIRDEKTRIRAVETVISTAEELMLHCIGRIESPIRGGDGNIEYLAYFVRKEGVI